jgi:membrane fusion protein (multidrug efflux system)
MNDVAIGRVIQGTKVKPPVRRLPKRPLIVGAVILILAGAGVRYGYDWWTVRRFVESTDDAYVGGNVTPISPHVAGFVTQILVGDNEFVGAGQPIIRLDNRDFQAAVDHAAAIVGQRRAVLASLAAKVPLDQAAVRQAEADLDGKTAQATFTKADDGRYHQLALTNYGSRQDAEKALAQNQAAEAAVASSQAALEAAKQQLIVLDADIDEARAAVVQAEADLRTAELDLGYTEIRAPIDGHVGNRAAEVGAYVSGGAYLATIIPTNGVWVDANFKEDQLELMAPGQSVTVVADLAPHHVFHGHVASLAPATGAVFSVIPPENATGNFTKIVQRVPVRITLDADDAMRRILRPGLSVTASVDTRSSTGDGQ